MFMNFIGLFTLISELLMQIIAKYRRFFIGNFILGLIYKSMNSYNYVKHKMIFYIDLNVT